MYFFHILLRAYLSPLYTFRLNFSLVSIFSSRQAGIVSTVFFYRRFRWHRWTRLFAYFWPVSTTPANNFVASVVDCCDERGLFFLQNCEPLGKIKVAAVRRQQYLRPPGSGGRGRRWCHWNLHESFSPVSLSPQIDLSPVSATPAITRNPWQRLIAGVNDTGDKFINSPKGILMIPGRGTLIHEKKLKSKISCQTPFK